MSDQPTQRERGRRFRPWVDPLQKRIQLASRAALICARLIARTSSGRRRQRDLCERPRVAAHAVARRRGAPATRGRTGRPAGRPEGAMIERALLPSGRQSIRKLAVLVAPPSRTHGPRKSGSTRRRKRPGPAPHHPRSNERSSLAHSRIQLHILRSAASNSPCPLTGPLNPRWQRGNEQRGEVLPQWTPPRKRKVPLACLAKT
jgi:hypothetical protein